MLGKIENLQLREKFEEEETTWDGFGRNEKKFETQVVEVNEQVSSYVMRRTDEDLKLFDKMRTWDK